MYKTIKEASKETGLSISTLYYTIARNKAQANYNVLRGCKEIDVRSIRREVKSKVLILYIPNEHLPRIKSIVREHIKAICENQTYELHSVHHIPYRICKKFHMRITENEYEIIKSHAENLNIPINTLIISSLLNSLKDNES